MSNIIFGAPRFVPPKENNKELNDVYMGVFFDGTSNNRKNIEGRRNNPKLKNTYSSNNDGSNTSYSNDHSNIDRLQKTYLYDAEKHYYTIYVEGIGTKNPDINKDETLSYYGDFTRGQAKGTGETGLFEKVEKGCFDVVTILKKENEISISTLYLDVFGFSRGAAAARIFVNELYKKKTSGDKKSFDLGYLGKAFKELDYKTKPVRIKVRLLGIYDTVSSYGDNVFDDVEVDKVPLKISNVGFTVHLTAEDEHRKNFPLTNIASAGANSIELTLPGCHSDIGGGYKNGEQEVVILTETGSKIEEEKKYVIEQGWFKSHELKQLPSLTPYYLKGTRESLSNEYSLVTLHLMAEFGKRKYKIPWKYKILDKDYKIPKELNNIKMRIDQYAFDGKARLKFYTNKQIEAKRKNVWHSQKEADEFDSMVGDHNVLLELRNQYLHCSASMDGIGMEPTQDTQSNIIWKRKIIAG
ncbi:T6SS phospholipase effector Tle1-like catalytic domain-containing protein [Flavobacterium sp.]|uniref:T6SS phospholipase effector Tle1-like catalytic domain-containing protein n=1 Tax=Flavobacterium sp. TaxID=239 RepID=UPI003D0BE1F2